MSLGYQLFWNAVYRCCILADEYADLIGLFFWAFNTDYYVASVGLFIPEVVINV